MLTYQVAAARRESLRRPERRAGAAVSGATVCCA